MFGGYEDVEAYEDELYREESSSEKSVDSEVECYLYSQVHYAQDLSRNSEQEDGEEKEKAGEVPPVDKSGFKFDPGDKPKLDKKFIVISDTDCVQISSGPEVITLSDTTEEDSVTRSKGKKKVTALHSHGKQRQCNLALQSTPSHSDSSVLLILDSSDLEDPRPQKGDTAKNTTSGKSSLIHKVLVTEESSEEEGECDTDSSEEEDEEEEDTSTSESDDLENWMLLGNDKEDADNSIQLNLEGCGTSAADEKGVEWSISEKDLEARIGNFTPFKRMNYRYYTFDKNIMCRNCDQRGHLSKNCSVPRKLPACCLCGVRGHLQYSCPARLCSNCCLPGHFSRECIEKAFWKKHCHRCSMTGHYADACPEIWRQYHLTILPGPIKKPSSSDGQKSELYCYNCAAKGHFGFECKRTPQGSYAACPFIYHYDRDHDIWKRDQRARLKVQELQDAGLLPLEIKKPHGENEDIYPPSKKRKKHCDKGHREDQRRKERKKKSWRERDREKKLKKTHVPWGYDMEEDFPRGSTFNSLKHSTQSSVKDTDPALFEHVKRAQVASLLLEEGKKKRKKHKRRRDHSTAADESLFSIKQRHKKSKRDFD